VNTKGQHDSPDLRKLNLKDLKHFLGEYANILELRNKKSTERIAKLTSQNIDQFLENVVFLVKRQLKFCKIGANATENFSR